MDYQRILGVDDLGPYKIHTRREIISLLRNISQQNQLVRMVFNKNSEAIVTSILDIDATNDSIVIDCAPEQSQNRRILGSEAVSFETTLDRIRIVFFSNYIEACQFEGRLALRIPLPESIVRLQRREYYRVETPSCRVVIPVQAEEGKTVEVTTTLRDLSVGGMGMVDDQAVLDHTYGRVYTNCRLYLTDGQVITVNVQVCNSYDIKLLNGKTQRRIGCLFVELSGPMLLAVQRYITRLERERNAKATGLA